MVVVVHSHDEGSAPVRVGHARRLGRECLGGDLVVRSRRQAALAGPQARLLLEVDVLGLDAVRCAQAARRHVDQHLGHLGGDPVGSGPIAVTCASRGARL